VFSSSKVSDLFSVSIPESQEFSRFELFQLCLLSLLVILHGQKHVKSFFCNQCFDLESFCYSASSKAKTVFFIPWIILVVGFRSWILLGCKVIIWIWWCVWSRACVCVEDEKGTARGMPSFNSQLPNSNAWYISS